MDTLTPLRFQPLFRRYLWGGRRLGELLGKPLGPDETCAESWEIVDRGADQSVVADGPWAGKTLAQVLAACGPALLGAAWPQPRFPLLFKFLDARLPLSVQVHPDDAAAARLDPPDLGKTEAWVVLHADPGARLYAGFRRGFDRPAVERELRRGTLALCLHTFEPRVGDCLFLPAGAVHALGAGLVVAEIQQSSDATFRLDDWKRLGPDGRPRPLHVEAGLAATDFSLGPLSPATPQPTERPHVEQLAACDKFTLCRWKLEQPDRLGGDGRCRIVAVIAGEVELAGDPAEQPLACGGVALLPAGLGPVAACPLRPSVLLEAVVPG